MKLESDIQNEIRVNASRLGGVLWRNNVGAYKTPTGYIRYGLCNDSPELNKHIKSADLIGIRPLLILPEHVGTVVGQFWSVECKSQTWKFNVNNPAQCAQLEWLKLVLAKGGCAEFNNTGIL